MPGAISTALFSLPVAADLTSSPRTRSWPRVWSACWGLWSGWTAVVCAWPGPGTRLQGSTAVVIATKRMCFSSSMSCRRATICSTTGLENSRQLRRCGVLRGVQDERYRAPVDAGQSPRRPHWNARSPQCFAQQAVFGSKGRQNDRPNRTRQRVCLAKTTAFW